MREAIVDCGPGPGSSTVDYRLSTALLVREEGFEPSRAFAHGILSPARLPVPPLSRSRHRRSNRMTIQRRAVTVAVMSKTVDCLRIAAVALAIFEGATIASGEQKVDPRIFAGRAELEKAS